MPHELQRRQNRDLILLRFQQWLKHEGRHYTDATIARIIGCDRATVGRWRRGTPVRSEPHAQRLSDFMDQHASVEHDQLQLVTENEPETGVNYVSLLERLRRIEDPRFAFSRLATLGDTLASQRYPLLAAPCLSRAAQTAWAAGQGPQGWSYAGKTLRAARITGSLESVSEVLDACCPRLEVLPKSKLWPDLVIGFSEFAVEMGCFLSDHGELEIFWQWGDLCRQFLVWVDGEFGKTPDLTPQIQRLQIRNSRDLAWPPMRRRLKPSDPAFVERGKSSLESIESRCRSLGASFREQQVINISFANLLDAVDDYHRFNDPRFARKAQDYLEDCEGELRITLEPWTPDDVRPPFYDWTAMHFLALKAMVTPSPRDCRAYRAAAKRLAAFSSAQFLATTAIPIASFVGIPDGERQQIDKRTRLYRQLQTCHHALQAMVHSKNSSTRHRG